MNRPGSPNAETVLLNIGIAVVHWEYLENQLFRIFHRFSSRNYYADKQLYSAIVSFKARTDVVEKLCRFRLLHEIELRDEVLKILRRARSLSTKRNQIVHGQLSQSKVTRDGKDLSGYFLTNSQYGSDIFSMHGRREYAFNHEEIRQFSDAFATCAKDIEAILSKIEKVGIFNEESFSTSGWDKTARASRRVRASTHPTPQRSAPAGCPDAPRNRANPPAPQPAHASPD